LISKPSFKFPGSDKRRSRSPKNKDESKRALCAKLEEAIDTILEDKEDVDLTKDNGKKYYFYKVWRYGLIYYSLNVLRKTLLLSSLFLTLPFVKLSIRKGVQGVLDT